MEENEIPEELKQSSRKQSTDKEVDDKDSILKRSEFAPSPEAI